MVAKADTAWLMTSTLLVLMMCLPGLAFFYGGLVRAKNVLSVMMQVLCVFSVLVIAWFAFGYTLAFGEGNAWIGNFDKLFLRGVTPNSLADTFTADVKIPEYAFVAFQSTFAGITGALIVGAFAERIKFRAVLAFALLWFAFAYLPVAHMVWAPTGLLFKLGAMDFAGGTVVHINAGIAGLVGAYFVGKRVGYGREAIKPHNVTFTLLGASLLWVGWFGFNAGSALEANGTATLAFINTLLAAAAGALSWAAIEGLRMRQPSMLGAASGIVAGLVGVTPACGMIGPVGALAIGAITSAVCVWGVSGLKQLLRADDSLDVFGLHGIGGMVGALLTAVFAAPALGGQAAADYNMLHQLGVQAWSIVLTVLWSGIVSVLAYLLVRRVFGLRVQQEEEREGLDIVSHGESAYD